MSEVKRYKPHPDDTRPEGWPEWYVAEADYDQLRGELSLAEEGLANYQQENALLTQANVKLQMLVIWAVDTMAALHRSIEPMENDPELSGRVPPAAMRAFVDALAGIDRERHAVPTADKP
jgi:hypothetical protein